MIAETIRRASNILMVDENASKELSDNIQRLNEQVVQLQAREADRTLTDGLQNVLHLLKFFIIKIEQKCGNYSLGLAQADSKVIFAAIRPIDEDPILDSPDELQFKTKAKALEIEVSTLFSNIGVDKFGAYDLDLIVQQRNARVHSALKSV